MKDHLVSTSDFLTKALSGVVYKIISEGIEIDVRADIAKSSDKQKKWLERRQKELTELLTMAWDSIYAAREKVPM